MLKYWVIFFIFIIGVSKSYVFYTYKNVEFLKRKIEREKQVLNLLKVEWTYLNQNSRLQKLAALYLKDWKPMEPDQLCDFKNIYNQTTDIKLDANMTPRKIPGQ